MMISVRTLFRIYTPLPKLILKLLCQNLFTQKKKVNEQVVNSRTENSIELLALLVIVEASNGNMYMYMYIYTDMYSFQQGTGNNNKQWMRKGEVHSSTGKQKVHICTCNVYSGSSCCTITQYGNHHSCWYFLSPLQQPPNNSNKLKHVHPL